MDFNDTPEEAEFRAEVRAWIKANAPTDWQDRVSRDADGLALSKEWQKKKFDAGWACIHWPKEFGGRGATPIQRVIWAQEEGALGQLSGAFIIGQGMCAPTVMAHGPDDMKAHHVPRVASGEEIWCQLFSEPGSGSDLAGLRTTAKRDGDEWVINGQKIWTSGAHYSDFGMLVLRTDPTVPKHKGLTMFKIDMKDPAVEVKPIKQVSGRSDFNEVYFTDLRVPDSWRIGEVGDGWRVSLTTLMNERLAVGGGFPTNFEEMFDMTREIDGDDGPALGDKAVREKLADWYIRSAGLRNTQNRMFSALSRGETPGPEASISKLVLGENRQNMASTMLDIQDMYGVLTGADDQVNDAQFQEIFFRAVAHRIEGGTDEILRNIIAERVLGLPGDIRVDKDVPFNEIPTGSA
ncbi:MAG: acyl-CoA dehydrogenase family protein [Alphaproteobacteria bacterium]